MPKVPAKYRVLKQSKLEKKAIPGKTIYACIEYDYGITNRDNRTRGVPHGCFTLKKDGDYPFFTMPMSDVRQIISRTRK